MQALPAGKAFPGNQAPSRPLCSPNRAAPVALRPSWRGSVGMGMQDGGKGWNSACCCFSAGNEEKGAELSPPRFCKKAEKQVLDVGNMNDWQRKSPLDWETYVNKLVKVVAVEKHQYEGWVLTVDPVSATIVLATFPENKKGSVSFIMGHAIQEVEILQEGDSDMKQRLAHISAPEESQAYSPEELEKRKNALKTWLQTNHIPVGEQGEQGRTLSVAGVLTIEPPYSPEQCSSTNEIILSRMQGLVQGYLDQQCPGPAEEAFCL